MLFLIAITKITKNLTQATQSLKVLSDLPLQVVIFYQTFQHKIEEDVSKLIHIMINSTLTLHPEQAIKYGLFSVYKIQINKNCDFQVFLK